MIRIFVLCLACSLAACATKAATSGDSDTASTDSLNGAVTGDTIDAGSAGTDFNAQASDFVCITKGTKVRNFYVVNPLGRLDAALAVANNADGGKYPVGTIIQLIPNEAMVKRFKGFNADSDDWEFFSLATDATSTTILQRGTSNVVNQFKGNCFSCHNKADPKFDLVCEETHGCAPLPFTAEQIGIVQSSDPRCP
jgi:hypothetical protein